MHYRVTHLTRYRYSAPVSLCHNEARVTPRSERAQTCLASNLTITPEPTSLSHRQDHFGNHVTYFDVEALHQELSVLMISEVTTNELRTQLDLLGTQSWEEVAAQVAGGGDSELRRQQQYLYRSPMISPEAALRDLALPSFTSGRAFVEAVLDLNLRIHTEFTYDPVATTIATPLSDVIESRRGVCQDFAHLMIGCLRSLGLPAGYVSGYLETQPPPGREKLRGVDASHAWVSVYLPGHGWLELDPTNGKMPDERYIVLARGRDYGDVTPLKGVIFGGGATSLHVSVDVVPEYDVRM